jgi:hypothetical protein
MMKFISIRELRSSSKKLKDMLRKNDKLLLTSNGKPLAIMTPVNEKNFEEKLDSVRRENARLALKKIQEESLEQGYDRLSMKEIEEIISESRKGRKGSRASK